MSITVAVTGGTGFIGKHIIDDLLSRGFAVRVLTRTIRHDVRDNLVWIRGALEDSEALAQLVAGAEHVIHCAGQVRGHTEAIFTRCNVEGSQRLMQAAKESGSCRRFLFISSLAARHPVSSDSDVWIKLRTRKQPGIHENKREEVLSCEASHSNGLFDELKIRQIVNIRSSDSNNSFVSYRFGSHCG
ncbi:NAD-dependent epimerase/dehydratase family protein [Citrobacter amalonaticus]|uniref:NAD-dependent epimerase/dehydratase family protein n=1 Tax=Citrobacter sp. CFNIH10 TaxID=1920110 RepID=UPI000CEC471B|nr:NAD-dependent epimerase/dehydratase family protein [Citrobacter sp. CFNIH10]AUZ65871.1 hypothetical protein C2U53_19705 [Citrobacter sp. CFNIH10]